LNKRNYRLVDVTQEKIAAFGSSCGCTPIHAGAAEGCDLLWTGAQHEAKTKKATLKVAF
jgi:hypothetical protein